MNPNINLHIDSIVLDGIDLGPGQSQVLQESVAGQLAEIFTQQGFGSPTFADSISRASHGANSIQLGHHTDAISLSAQLANAIHADIPRSYFGSRTPIGGQT